MRILLVVGASSGIGRAAAQALRRDDTVVWTGSSSLEDHPASRRLHLDVTDPGSIRHAINLIREQDGMLHGMVNAAGIVRDEFLLQSHRERWETVMNVNFWGTFELMRAASRLLINANCDTSIVNVASVSALHPRPGQGAYAASKAAVLALTTVAAQELARWNIRVNAVAPGFIDTPMLKSLSAAQRDGIRHHALAGRLGTADEVAGVIKFLLSQQSCYVTGTVITVDGGLLAATPPLVHPKTERSGLHVR